MGLAKAFILTGIVIELIGALILAGEDIGIASDRWTKTLSIIAGLIRADDVLRRNPLRFSTPTVLASGVVVGMLLYYSHVDFPQWHVSKPMQYFLIALVGAGFYFVIYLLLRLAIWSLRLAT